MAKKEIKEDKQKRTHQVQFRMEPELFKRLKATIALDDNLMSMTDLFNNAAREYLKKRPKV